MTDLRGCGIIRDRCQQYIAGLKRMGYDNTLPVEKAKELFCEILDIYDRTSIKAYFGTLPGRSERTMTRWATYLHTGTQSPKEIKIIQKIPKRIGYLERLQLVTYEQRGIEGKVWFMVLKNPPIVAELVKVCKTIEHISLTHKLSEGVRGNRDLRQGLGQCHGCTENVTQHGMVVGERGGGGLRVREKSGFPMQSISDMPLSIFSGGSA